VAAEVHVVLTPRPAALTHDPPGCLTTVVTAALNVQAASALLRAASAQRGAAPRTGAGCAGRPQPPATDPQPTAPRTMTAAA
jgi:hypothetical protein